MAGHRVRRTARHCRSRASTTLLITADGYLKKQIEITATVGQVTPLHISLTPASVINIQTVPPHLRVHLNGVEHGESPQEIKDLEPRVTTS